MQTRMDNKRENIFRHEYHDAHEKTIQPKQSKRVGDKRPGSQQHFSVSIPRFNPMKKSLSVFLLAVMSAAGAIVNAINFNSTSVDVALANIPVAAQLSKKFVAYFIAWGIYGRNYQPSDIPADKLTHINYAFANIDASGRVALGDSYADIDKAYPGDSWDTSLQPFRGTFNQIMNVIRKEHPHLKVLLSVGGWTWSAKFSDVAKDDGGRETFAQSCLDMIEKYGFDGIDIDWEYPVEGGLSSNVYRPEDGANYVLLLNAIRAKIGSEKLLTIASAAGPQLTRHLDIPGLASVLDFVNIMTYDFRGGWSKFTGHQTPLYPSSTDPDASLTDTATVVDYFLKQGMPAEKICIGAAIYGRGWSGASAENNGLFQTFASVPKGTWDDGTSGSTGVFDYKDVVNKLRTGELKRFWDDEVKAAWAFNSDTGLMISYDDIASIKEKCKFVWNKNLGGVMVWELSGDDKDESLVDTIYAGLSSNDGGDDDSTTRTQSISSSATPSSSMTQPTSMTRTSSSVVETTATTTASSSSTGVVTSSTSLVLVGPKPTNKAGNCVQAGTACRYGTDGYACYGAQLTVCATDNKWLAINCAPGTNCQLSKDGMPFCNFPNSPGFTSCGAPAPSSNATLEPTSESVEGTKCSLEGKTDCVNNNQYARCINGKYLVRSCAPGTSCKQNDDAAVCAA